MEGLERTCLVNDSDAKKYSLTMNSTNLLQNNANKQKCGEEPVVSGSSSLHHCHDRSTAYETRKREQQQASRKLYMASVMCLIFMMAEVIGGRIAGSLAVMTDAAHMLVDLLSFLISLFSLWLSLKRPSKRLTFGWHRAEILGAFLSMSIIWAVTGMLTYFAIKRLLHPHYEIQGTVMLITSSCAVIANMILSLMLYQTGHGHAREGPHATYHIYKPVAANASVRAAFIHAVGDLFQSISVLISALIIFFKPEYKMADSICTFVFSLFVLGTTLTILRDVLVVLMEGTPKGLSYDDVKEKILAMDKVKSVHNLHLWSLTMNQTVLMAHIVTVDSADKQQILKEMTEVLFDAYNFHTVTLQIEPEAAQKPECVFCQDPRD
ncbi:proton-coupled zinc antiporter SLC30A8 [Eublepharis macularius]|uniref:Proton-coupled zinc antiporter SLC30A8 n=1 Tax=Eublepharis macularius TaxID=481883 RepID=A0AA97L4D3_EUBMA|nr:proton-coupled zinc antiporter SLC30A8 [Eublepharis macularius]